MKSPFTITIRKIIKGEVNKHFISVAIAIFKNSLCDRIEQTGENRLTIKNEFFRVKPDLNWNLWNGIGNAELGIEEGENADEKNVVYNFDFSRATLTFVAVLILFFLFIAVKDGLAGSVWILKFVGIVLGSLGILTHLIMFFRQWIFINNLIAVANGDKKDYDWPKIFSRKTDEELREIAEGKAHLPFEIEQLAKEELARRFTVAKEDPF